MLAYFIFGNEISKFRSLETKNHFIYLTMYSQNVRLVPSVQAAEDLAKYKAENPGSKLKTAVTGDVKPGSKDAGRRKSFCARSKGWTGERGKAARARWKC